MDIVEIILVEGPGLVDVVHFEATVRWKEIWLDRRNIDARHFGGWILVGEFANQDPRETFRPPNISDWEQATYIAHAPVPVPTSRTRWNREFLRQYQSSRRGQMCKQVKDYPHLGLANRGGGQPANGERVHLVTIVALSGLEDFDHKPSRSRVHTRNPLPPAASHHWDPFIGLHY